MESLDLNGRYLSLSLRIKTGAVFGHNQPLSVIQIISGGTSNDGKHLYRRLLRNLPQTDWSIVNQNDSNCLHAPSSILP